MMARLQGNIFDTDSTLYVYAPQHAERRSQGKTDAMSTREMLAYLMGVSGENACVTHN